MLAWADEMMTLFTERLMLRRFRADDWRDLLALFDHPWPTDPGEVQFDLRFHGRGYVSEACRAILARAFGPLQAERVVTGTAVVNRPAVRLLERLGFRKTSESRQSFRNDSAGHAI